MSSSDAAGNEVEHTRPLYVSIEIVANLVYLARNSEEASDQRRLYLERAADILREMRHHPDLPE